MAIFYPEMDFGSVLGKFFIRKPPDMLNATYGILSSWDTFINFDADPLKTLYLYYILYIMNIFLGVFLSRIASREVRKSEPLSHFVTDAEIVRWSNTGSSSS